MSREGIYGSFKNCPTLCGFLPHLFALASSIRHHTLFPVTPICPMQASLPDYSHALGQTNSTDTFSSTHQQITFLLYLFQESAKQLGKPNTALNSRHKSTRQNWRYLKKKICFTWNLHPQRHSAKGVLQIKPPFPHFHHEGETEHDTSFETS